MKFSLAISDYRTPLKKNPFLITYIVLFGGLWLSTFIGTSDINNWFLENTLVILFLGVLIFTFKKLQFSDLTYTFIFVYLSLHVYGSKYTYAENPFGYWLMEAFHTSRNHYDRIVHFSFGFLLGYPMRELFYKGFKFPSWTSWILPIEITMSFSGLYEIIEWAVADVFFPSQGVAYLGTQGDIWDAQKDMFLATLGAILITIIVLLAKRILGIYELKKN
jgi:putative membrane protein